MNEAPENRTGRPTSTFPCRGHQPTRRRLRVRVRGLPRPAALIPAVPQVGPAFEAPALCSGRSPSRPRDCAACCRGHRAPAFHKEESLARPGQRQTGARRTAPRQQRRVRPRGDVVSVLARTVREVEAAAQRGRVTPAVRTKFQAVALLLRDERARVRAAAGSDSHRAEQLKRLDGVATVLATTAVQDAGLLALLAEDSGVSDAARSLKREMLRDFGIEPAREEIEPTETAKASAGSERRVLPQSVISRQLANPFLSPDSSAVPQRTSRPRRLAGWELLGPLLSSFERAGEGAPACMALTAPAERFTPAGLELMPHQGQLVAAAAAGHRTFLLADEPGLGKTAQALLAAEVANAYPLLVVVPNVVKTNWAREAARWTPHRPATVVQGDGETVDGFADIVVLNYELLDRHVGWLGDFGFRGMVVDEAHFIKNKTSRRSQHVLALSDRIRSRTPRPLLMALTGTPLINDLEDFRAIWQFLGWIDDIPVERDGRVGRSIRAAERDLAGRMVTRYETAVANRSSDAGVEGIDHDLVRRVARSELKDATTAQSGENVFTMMRRIGQAKADLAADYAAQLARSAGKVVFFAKHVDVMDAAEQTFARQGMRFSSIRGDQTPTARQANVDAFVNDPDVAVAVCSLTAAGVGLN